MKNNIYSFYTELPFNISSEKNLLKTRKNLIPWTQLDHAIANCNSVCEVGCGNGWLTHRIANKYPNKKLTAIDFVEKNIKLASIDNTTINFRCENFLDYKEKADCLISIGVLHHIPELSLTDLIIKAINLSNKYTFLGLYHSSRSDLFEYFEQVPETNRFRLFKKMNPHIVDSTQIESWFRDQFFNPYETTISVLELKDIANTLKVDIKYISFEHDDRYANVIKQLNSFEFTSCMIYIMFEKK